MPSHTLYHKPHKLVFLFHIRPIFLLEFDTAIFTLLIVPPYYDNTSSIFSKTYFLHFIFLLISCLDLIMESPAWTLLLLFLRNLLLQVIN